MFDTKITLFNYDVRNDVYYSTLIVNTEFQPMYKTKPDVTQTNDEDSSLIIIPYNIRYGTIYINSDDLKKEYLNPYDFHSKENKSMFFTIQNNIDIVIIGDYTNINTVNLNDLKNSNDNVFMVNKFKDFKEPLISHFELVVN